MIARERLKISSLRRRCEEDVTKSWVVGTLVL
jgi:hypothetical protein